MAWYSDEQWEYMQDCKDKSITARSAKNTRSHCGRGGKVKLPSDYMTKKELKSMNGECKSYRLNSPMSWEEFKSMPDDLKVVYIKALREKYNVPSTALAEMFGICGPTLSRYLKCLGLAEGKSSSISKRSWNKEAFLAWRNGVKVEETEKKYGDELIRMSNEFVEAAKAAEETDIPENEEEKDVDKILDSNAMTETVGTLNDLIGKTIDTYPDGLTINCAGPLTFVRHHMPVIPKSGTMTFNNNLADDALDTIKTILSNVRVNLTVSWECAFEEE